MDENIIISEYQRGLSSLQISRKYGCSKKKVLSILKSNNIERRSRNTEITAHQITNVIDLYNKKETISEIEKQSGLSKKNIYKVLHENNIVRNLNAKITETVKTNIVNDYLNGKTFNQIMECYNIKGSGTISKILKEKNIKVEKHIHNKVGKEIRENIINEYKNGLNICELHEKYGYGTTTIARWVKKAGITRSFSDAFTLSAIKGRKHFKGTNLPWYSTKNKCWYVADSIWEAVRMKQLDEDMNVVSWEKSEDRIPYVDLNGEEHYYIPDFKVYYIGNNISVEEVKPQNLVNTEINLIKINTAKNYYKKLGITYLVITENEIGVENIKNFSSDGLIKYTQEERKERRRKLRNKREKERRRNAKINNNTKTV